MFFICSIESSGPSSGLRQAAADHSGPRQLRLLKLRNIMPITPDLAVDLPGQTIVVLSVGAALIIVVLFKLPYVGRAIRALFSFALLALCIYLVL